MSEPETYAVNVSCMLSALDSEVGVQVPRGLENTVAIDLITEHIKWRLAERLQSNSTAA